MIPSASFRLVPSHQRTVLGSVGSSAIAAAASGLVPVGGAVLATPAFDCESRDAVPMVSGVSRAAVLAGTSTPVRSSRTVGTIHTITIPRDKINIVEARRRSAGVLRRWL